MATLDPAVYFDASYGGIDLLISAIDTSGGRDVAIQSPARGNQHALQDRGRKLLTTNATLLFIDQAGQDAYTTRFDRVRKLAEGGEAQLFSHPILGSYRARISDFNHRASSDEQSIEVQATILAEEEAQTVFPAGGGVTGDAGLEAVTTAAAQADTALADVTLTSTAPAASVTAVTGWSMSLELDSNKVLAELATITGQIADVVDAYNLATDLARWPAYQAMLQLSYQLARAAEVFTSPADKLFDLVVLVPQPVRVICARIYGAALAEDRAEQVVRLNRVRTPGRVPAGSRLKLPSNGARP